MKAPPKRSNLRSSHVSHVPQTRSLKGKEKYQEHHESDTGNSDNENMHNHVTPTKCHNEPSFPPDPPETSSKKDQETLCPPETPKQPEGQPNTMDSTENSSPLSHPIGSIEWIIQSICTAMSHFFFVNVSSFSFLGFNLATGYADMSESTDQIQAHMSRTDVKLESLNQAYKLLSDVLSQNINSPSTTKTCTKKTRGGQLAVGPHTSLATNL